MKSKVIINWKHDWSARVVFVLYDLNLIRDEYFTSNDLLITKCNTGDFVPKQRLNLFGTFQRLPGDLDVRKLTFVNPFFA